MVQINVKLLLDFESSIHIYAVHSASALLFGFYLNDARAILCMVQYIT